MGTRSVRPAARPTAPARGRRGTSLVEIVVVVAILSTALSMFAGTVGAVMVERRVARESVVAAEGAENFIERLRGQDFRQVWALYNADPSDDPDGPGTAPGPRFAIDGLDPGDSVDGLVGEVRFPDQWVGPSGQPATQNQVEKALGETAQADQSAPASGRSKGSSAGAAAAAGQTTTLVEDVLDPGLTVGPAPAPAPSGPTLQLREDLDDPALGLPRDLNGDSIVDGLDHADDYFLLPLEVTVRWRGRSGDRTLRRVTMLCELKW